MKNTHSFNFLLEILISIIFFTICSMVFVGLFYLSNQMNKEALIKTKALSEVTSIYEEFKENGTCNYYDGDGYSIVSQVDDNVCHIKAISNDKVLIEVDSIYLGDTYE